ncbi:MAG TPA: translation initiation factor IF-2 [Candidatus Paceibacterota bacterium]|nr:translation initiation factor IF-2 [Candidatus Paceibacterota bacterium]
MNKSNTKKNVGATSSDNRPRPPVVVIMGHVDHGKSTLLDYIRKSNIVGAEAGGITQHISAYEVLHKNDSGENKMITFLDTPGHEAFSKMRARGASAADIAVLVVSAEDSIKAQTIEAYNTIIESKIPYIVAINKIDKPSANIEKVKMDLVEEGIYLEGMGGDIPYVPISAKVGTGINELLDMILLVADLQGFAGNPKIPAKGVIIEANREPKRGISAACIIKDGTLKSGMFVVSGTAIVNTRIFENFLGKPIKEATFSSPILLSGFESMPEVGSVFESFNTKKEAESYASNKREEMLDKKAASANESQTGKIIPIIIKTDAMGTIEALEKEINKLNSEEISFKIISAGVGAISESDIKMGNVNKESIIVGFNIKMDNGARDLNESLKVNIQIFNIIYKLTDWLKEIVEERRPRVESIEVTGSLKVLKKFGATKERQVVGGKVTTGRITLGGTVRIIRRDFEIGKGRIVELQMNKIKSKEIQEGNECGVLVESKIDIAPGDTLEAFIIAIK